MKKFIRSFLLFLGFTALGYPVLLFLWGKIASPLADDNLAFCRACPGHMYTRLKEVRTEGDTDVLFLGSSHAYRGFDPRFFEKRGLDVFNLGSSSQTPLQSLFLLEKYLEKLQPEVAVIEVYPTVFTLDGLESYLDIVSNEERDPRLLDQALTINHIKGYNTLAYSWMNSFLHEKKDIPEPVQRGPDRYISGGYVERSMSHYSPDSFPKQKLELRAEQLEAFEESLELLAEHNVDVVLCFAPVTSSLYESYENMDTFDSLMDIHGEYYNFNEILDMTDSLHFYDADHLNQKGVEIFDRALLDIIAETVQQ